MVLNIKDPVTDRLVRELAHETGESLTESLRIAVEERLRRVRARPVRDSRRAELEALVARGRARTERDPRPADEILGYDEQGMPG